MKLLKENFTNERAYLKELKALSCPTMVTPLERTSWDFDYSIKQKASQKPLDELFNYLEVDESIRQYFK